MFRRPSTALLNLQQKTRHPLHLHISYCQIFNTAGVTHVPRDPDYHLEARIPSPRKPSRWIPQLTVQRQWLPIPNICLLDRLLCRQTRSSSGDPCCQEPAVSSSSLCLLLRGRMITNLPTARASPYWPRHCCEHQCTPSWQASGPRPVISTIHTCLQSTLLQNPHTPLPEFLGPSLVVKPARPVPRLLPCSALVFLWFAVGQSS